MVIHKRKHTAVRMGDLWHDEVMHDPVVGIDPRLEYYPRFLTLTDLAETLNISAAQAYALVRNGELAAIKIGGRGQWRVESQVLEKYISTMYVQTKEFVQMHPFCKDESVALKNP